LTRSDLRSIAIYILTRSDLRCIAIYILTRSDLRCIAIYILTRPILYRSQDLLHHSASEFHILYVLPCAP